MNDDAPETYSDEDAQELTGLDRLAARIDALPDSVKPIVMGPLLLILLMKMRGAFILGPIVITVLLIQSDDPLHSFMVGAGIFATLLLASAMGGALYSALGRRLKDVPMIGPYAAGMLCVAPYVLALTPIVRLDKGTPVIAAFTADELFTSLTVTVIIGSVLGHMLFRPHSVEVRE